MASEENKRVTFDEEKTNFSEAMTSGRLEYSTDDIKTEATPKSKFQVDIEDIIDFVFPSILQHPLAAGRLFAFGMYGPLDEENMLRTGPRGAHKTTVWELDAMCKQIEREDLISIYLDEKTSLGLLSTEEQESIMAQADAHLKKAKGRAMLPQISKQDIYNMFEELPRDSLGYLSFHDLQDVIAKYRSDRIKNYKLVFPRLVSKNAPMKSTMMMTGTSSKRRGKVSTSVAPSTMFQRMKGQTNPDVIKQTNLYLNKHAYKMSDIDATNESAMTANVRLLREVEPRCPDPYTDPATGETFREKWNDTCNIKGTHMGSMVKAAASKSTWKRNATLHM